MFTPSKGPNRLTQRYCSTVKPGNKKSTCRVQAQDYGDRFDDESVLKKVASTASRKPVADTTDTTLAAAVYAAQTFTQIPLDAFKSAAGITVERVKADPAMWKVTVPGESATAAETIADALREHADDITMLANLLSRAAQDPPKGRGRRRG